MTAAAYAAILLHSCILIFNLKNCITFFNPKRFFEFQGSDSGVSDRVNIDHFFKGKFVVFTNKLKEKIRRTFLFHMKLIWNTKIMIL